MDYRTESILKERLPNFSGYNYSPKTKAALWTAASAQGLLDSVHPLFFLARADAIARTKPLAALRVLESAVELQKLEPASQEVRSRVEKYAASAASDQFLGGPLSAARILFKGVKLNALDASEASKDFVKHAASAARQFVSLRKKGKEFEFELAKVLEKATRNGIVSSSDASELFTTLANAAGHRKRNQTREQVLLAGVRSGVFDAKTIATEKESKATEALNRNDAEQGILFLNTAARAHLETGTAGLDKAEEIALKMKGLKLPYKITETARGHAALLLDEILERRGKWKV
ncbi:TPA: hypothetical protein HA318_00100 [Candidatus Micrarchaeota archaeon]|nr:MAG: hypothetical protein AUJ65_04575 [Candidatus Micrarchaeota archaeon CG1_02_51_15]HII38391.1 hypothetical protein [Candidatus Micrarchaeota archaeon]